MSSYSNSIFSQLNSYINREDKSGEKILNEQQKYLDDPSIGERLLAKHSALAVPDSKKGKISSATSLAKVEKYIPSSDPRKGIARSVLEDTEDLIAANPGVNPSTILSEVYKKRTEGASEEIFKYKRKQDKAWLFSDETASMPGYEEWAKNKDSEEWEWSNPLAQFGIGAGISAAGMGIGKIASNKVARGTAGTIAKFAARKLGGKAIGSGVGAIIGSVFPGAGTVAGGVIGAGIGMAIDMFGYDIAKNLIAKSDWGKSKQIEGQLDIADIASEAAGFASFSVTGGTIAKMGKKILSTRAAAVDAATKMAEETNAKSVTEFALAKNKAERAAASAAERAKIMSEDPGQDIMRDLMPEGTWHNIPKEEKSRLASMADDITSSYGLAGPKVIKKPLTLKGDEAQKVADVMEQTGISATEATAKVMEESIGSNRIKTLALKDMLAERKDITGDFEKMSLVRRLNAAGETPNGILKIIDEGDALNSLEVGARIRTVQYQKEQGLKNRLVNMGYPEESLKDTPYGMMKKMYQRDPERIAEKEGNRFLKDIVAKRTNESFLTGKTGIAPEENIRQLDAMFTEVPAEIKPVTKVVKEIAAPITETSKTAESIIFKPVAGKEEQSVYEHFKGLGLTPEGQSKVFELVEPHIPVKGSVFAQSEKSKTILAAYEKYKDDVLKNVPNEVEQVADTTRTVLGRGKKEVKVVKPSTIDYKSMTLDQEGITKAFSSGKTMIKKKLSDVIGHPELFEKYPELKNTTITITNKVAKDSSAARVVGGENHITVYDANYRMKSGDLGRTISHEIEHIINPGASEAVVQGVDAGVRKVKFKQKILPIAIATGGIAAASAFLSPEEADAGVIDKAAKMVVAPYVAKVMKQETKSGAEMVQKLVEGHYYSPPVNEMKNWEFPGWMRVPQVIPDVKQLVYKGAAKFMDKIWSPSVVAEKYYGASEEGVRAMANPMVELGLREVASQANSQKLLEVSGNILSHVPGFKTAKVEVAKRMESIESKYGVKIGEARAHSSGLAFLDKEEIPKLERALTRAKTPEDKMVAENVLNTAKKNRDFHQTELARYDDIKKEYETVVDAAHYDLAQKHSSTRIALATEGVGMGQGGWLEPLLTQDERVAAGRFREMLDTVAARMKEVGEAPIEKTPYIHHAIHPKADWKSLKESINQFSLDGDSSYLMSHFHHRSYASKQMMPDIEYVMEKYIPDAMKRIEMADFWKRGTQDGWEAHRRIVNANHWSGAMEFWNGIDKAMLPVEKNTVSQATRLMYALEVSRLLFMSPSVAFKHAMKLEANMSNFGFAHSASMYPSTMGETIKTYVRPMAGKLGVKNPDDLANDVLKTYTQNNRLVSVIQDMGLYDPPQTWAERMVQKFNEKGATLVNFTERFDRAHSFLAAMDMAGKKGMTAEQAAYGVMDTILKTNFLSGVQNPAWLRNPNVRLMMMFQGTPFKIMEQRLLLAQRAGKDIANTAKDLAILSGLKKDVRNGRDIFKTEVMKDGLVASLTKSKDIFGIPFTAQLARKAAILGTIIIGGKQLFDVDMAEHVIHIPGIKKEGSSLMLSTNPVLNAALEAKANEENDDTWVSDFFKKWLPSGPVPAILMKANRLSESDIPERYRGSKFRYLFGIPSIPTKED